MSDYLSKSRYCSAVQCPKMLWLKDHKAEEADTSVMNQAVLDTGSEVGDLAMGMFGEYTEIPFSDDLHTMLSLTDELIRKGTRVIAEASFSFNGCFCSVDILKNIDGHTVELYEVKSSTSVHEIYKYDVSYQYYVLKSLGYDVRKACLVHINSRYVRHGELDLSQYFVIEDLTKTAEDHYKETEKNIALFRTYNSSETEPVKEISEACSDPYDCIFYRYCSRDLPSPNVFDLAAVQKRTKWKYYRDGYISFEDLYCSGKLNENALIQVDHEIHDLPEYVNTEAITRTLDALSYPLYFLDFESFNPAVPPYDDTRPFEQIVFQYSLHYIEYEGGPLVHKEFLAYPGKDPRRSVAEHLVQDIPLNVCTTAYNMTFEKTRIKELAELYPDLSGHLLNIRDHIQDLMIPFQKKYFYRKAMQGSYSIKYVLPALYPDDPSLDYHHLEGIHNGAEASDAFKAMARMDQKQLEQYRNYLLKYCGLDTFAMVKVWESLNEKAGRVLNKTW